MMAIEVRRLCAFVYLVCFVVSPAFGASPSLGSVTPRGIQRGTDATLFFNGARLADAKEILFHSPGLTVTALQAVNDGQVKATLKVAPDCRLGEHAVRVRTATGLSELRTFFVGPFPAVDEKEPNNDFAAPQPITLNVTVQGVVNSEDVDYYAVDCKKGQRLSAEIEGMRLGNTLFDPYLAILDSKRFELAATDDAPLLGQDPICSIVCPADGKYIVQVRESAYGGNGACAYRLHVGTYPRPIAVIPAGGKPGEEIELSFLGDPTGPFKQKVKLPATVDPNFGVIPQDANGSAPSAMPFRLLAAESNVIEREPNQDHATATPCAVPGAVNGVVSKAGQVDHYRFKAAKGQAFEVHCYARRIGSPLDPVMTIANLNGGAIVSNDDSGGPDSYFRFTAPEEKEYVLTVSDHLAKGGETYFYRVEFTAPQPLSTVSIPRVAQYSQERQTIPVPRGNRFACLLNVARSQWGGDTILGADTLPPGITMQADTLPGNLDTFPVVFEAAANAAPSGLLVDLQARPADDKVKVPSQFRLPIDMIVGAPGQSIYLRHFAQRTAVAVTDEAPFKIEIVEPKVPLVQNGSMGLKIKAERKAGYNEAITIIPLWNPPGVGSASSATIAAGQTETVLPINANGGAPARKWKYAVLGTANSGGPLWVSSQLATLEVAPPFVTFALERAAAEQGKDTEMFCKVTPARPFDGAAKVRLIGVPAKVTVNELDITKDTKEFAFKLGIDKAAPAGNHRNLFCQVVIMQNGEPVTHNLGSSELRIDVPLPPKPNQPPPPAAPTVAAKPMPAPMPNQPPPKRLTRLEQLRLEQAEREKSTPPAAPMK